jgi:hypothetical protein
MHDWRCVSQRARYDGSMSEQVLGWQPISDREMLVERGIADAVRWYMR